MIVINKSMQPKQGHGKMTPARPHTWTVQSGDRCPDYLAIRVLKTIYNAGLDINFLIKEPTGH